ncbi:hypothetical protein WJX84_010890 [Apatococcus fuscideae]|uniref:TLC domain-containing protein n=1 Tax=Apatococcus fuscideae TaxID=2026836 RepID=A0AAW1SR24_9CHLO
MFPEPLDLILDREGIRHEYRRFCEHRKQHPREYPAVQDFTGALWLVCVIIGARLLFNRLLNKPVQHLLERRKLPAHRQEVYKLLEEIWVTLGGMVLMIWAIYVASNGLGKCSLWNRFPCLHGWPYLPAPAILKMYYNVELAWYLHLLPKYRLGYGERDSIDMKAHHAATISLILGSYAVYIHLIDPPAGRQPCS